MLREVQSSSDDDHAEDEEHNRVCAVVKSEICLRIATQAPPVKEYSLSTNFSVGVSMYRLNVTSYWYRLSFSQWKKARVEIAITAASKYIKFCSLRGVAS